MTKSKKILYVGDVHCTPDAIDDCQNLVDLIDRTADAWKVDAIVFLGDQYHTHAIMHVEVMAFWKRAFKKLVRHEDCSESEPPHYICTGMNRRIYTIVGNHDKPGDPTSTSTAMMAHEGEVTIIDKPTELFGALYLPYYHDLEAFVKDCNERTNLKVVVCHQTFNGSTYENGFPAEDGVEIDSIPQAMVISGHIHTPQNVGKVWYPGAPRWRTISDANVERAIYVMEHREDGLVSPVAAIDTGKVCRQILSFKDFASEPLELEKDVLSGKHRVAIDVHGPEDYVKTRKVYWEGFGVRVRTFPETRKVIKVKESDGIPVAFRKYADSFAPPNGTNRELLVKVMSERLGYG